MGKSAEKEIKRAGDKVVKETSRVFEDVVDPGNIISEGVEDIGNLFSSGGGGSKISDSVADKPFTPPPNLANQAILDALNLARARRGAATGRQSTIRTGPQGITGPSGAQGIELTGV